jgi:hypothetical protein
MRSILTTAATLLLIIAGYAHAQSEQLLSFACNGTMKDALNAKRENPSKTSGLSHYDHDRSFCQRQL